MFKSQKWHRNKGIKWLYAKCSVEIRLLDSFRVGRFRRSFPVKVVEQNLNLFTARAQ